MLKTFRKAISVFVLAVFVLSLIPTGVFAENGSVIIGVQNYGTCYYKTPNAPSGVVSENGVNNICTARAESSDKRYAYGQFDLTGYEEILGNPSTKVTYIVRLGGGFGGSKCSKLTVQLFNDEHDYDDSSITYNQAKELGLHGTGDLVIFQQTAADGEQRIVSSAEVDVAGLVSVLRSGTDNSIVCYAASTTTSAPVYFRPAEANTGLKIEYESSEINNLDYVNSAAEKLTWDKISADPIEAVTSDTILPSKFYGADVAWSSNVPGLIDETSGRIIPRGSAKEATFTATLSYKGAHESAPTATITKTFTATISAEEPKVAYIPFFNYAHSRDSDQNNSDAKNHKYIYETFGSNNSRYNCIKTAGSFEGYAQIDLAGYEEILRNPETKVSVQLEAGYQYASSAKINPMTAYVGPDSADSYSNETITWNIANNIGLHSTNSPGLFTITDKGVSSGECAKANVNINVLSDALANSSDSIISIHLDAGKIDGKTAESCIRMSSQNSGLFISYYESEIDNEAFFGDIENAFTWENLSSDDAGAVVNDLPNYYKGANVVWSSGEGCITSSGELIPTNGQIIKDTLTATVSFLDKSFTKTFNVTICDGNVTLGTPELTVADGKATANISIVNGTAKAVTYNLYLAVYTGNELTELTPFTFEIDKASSSSKTITATCGDESSAKFLVWENDNITPATVFVEK